MLSGTLNVRQVYGWQEEIWKGMSSCTAEPAGAEVMLARVLLVDDDPRSRLALQTVLQAGGYQVETAASAAEAVRKLDEGEYQLVLTDLTMESHEAGYRVVDHAGITPYKPAVAIISTSVERGFETSSGDEPVLIEPEDLPGLLTKVADLISGRASRRVARDLRHA